MHCDDCCNLKICNFVNGIWMSDQDQDQDEVDIEDNELSDAHLYYCPLKGCEELRLMKDITTIK
ncbi:hypothetical protein GMB50_10595 [Turicibacter sanguinis]|nr:hypothetical protein [Turicibacter sanguinis]MTP47968.1 hypothetical protein [Turicibacter sanguinis]MTP50716.1 hypothetical protein [Turicibacter sanguinis]MTQ07952.1 hypothetical protein [Turicibacter sanguinis]